MGYYKYMRQLYRDIKTRYSDPEEEDLRQQVINRKKKWRKQAPVVKVERPTRPGRARNYGYKAKQGFIITRVRTDKGVNPKKRPVKGRRPKRAGQIRIYPRKNKQVIAEEKAQRKYRNLEVLGSYWAWEDGQYKWFEIIMVDPSHPVIKSDDDINWICKKQHKGRVFRGLTPAAKKSRGLRKKGKGTEKVRPSQKSNNRRGK